MARYRVLSAVHYDGRLRKPGAEVEVEETAALEHVRAGRLEAIPGPSPDAEPPPSEGANLHSDPEPKLKKKKAK
ncbi:MAG: hypothetical protein H7841_08275 [Magnetospirillum sp. WYHS-4]